MITVLTGDNSFEVAQVLERLRAEFDGTPETVDGSELELRQLPDLLMGATLFAPRRLVVVKGLADNKVVWEALPDWLGRIDDDIHVVLIEPKLDKRSRTYKALQKTADIREYKPWGERDTAKAEQWMISHGKALGVTLSRPLARQLVTRVGVDQWALHHALEKLALAGSIDAAVIDELIDRTPNANVFALMETALRGDHARLHAQLAELRATNDPYQLLGLLAGQAFQLAALSVTDKSPVEVAKDLGASPYALSQLAKFRRQLTRSRARQIVAALAEADHDSKTTGQDVWLLIERGLMKIGRTHPPDNAQK